MSANTRGLETLRLCFGQKRGEFCSTTLIVLLRFTIQFFLKFNSSFYSKLLNFLFSNVVQCFNERAVVSS